MNNFLHCNPSAKTSGDARRLERLITSTLATLREGTHTPAERRRLTDRLAHLRSRRTNAEAEFADRDFVYRRAPALLPLMAYGGLEVPIGRTASVNRHTGEARTLIGTTPTHESTPAEPGLTEPHAPPRLSLRHGASTARAGRAL